MLANATFFHGDDAAGHERDGNKDSIIPIFKRARRLNQKKSEAEGRAIYDEFDQCHFLIPGDKTYEHIEGVTEEHKRRFRRQWDDYQSGREQINGEPLESWYEIANHPGIVDEMRALKVRSVSDLANMNDDFVGRNMGWSAWRDKARKYVATQASKEALAGQNAELVAQLAAVSERLAKLESGPTSEVKRGPGRPPKQAEE